MFTGITNCFVLSKVGIYNDLGFRNNTVRIYSGSHKASTRRCGLQDALSAVILFCFMIYFFSCASYNSFRAYSYKPLPVVHRWEGGFTYTMVLRSEFPG